MGTVFSRYDESQQRAGQRAMIAEGVFTRVMEGVTSGVILAGFALALGATDFQIGLLAAIPFLSQLAHLVAVPLLGRFPDRRAIVVGAAVVARLLFVLMAALPFLGMPLAPIHALIPLMILYATIATVGGAAWQVWVRELVPREQLGAYFGRRMIVLSFVGLVTLLAAGQFIAWWSARHPGEAISAFSILFVLGSVMGLVSAAVLRRAPNIPSLQTRSVGGLGASLRKPLQDRNYRGMVIFLGAWGFAANLALPFVSVVLLRTLGYGFGVVTLLAALSQVANITGLRFWSPLSDRFGNKPILTLSASVFVVSMAAWAFTIKEPSTYTLVVAGIVHVLFGFAVAGLDLAGNNIVLKMASEEDAPAYMASASVVKAIATGTAPLLGGAIVALLEGRAFLVRLAWSYPGGESTVTALRFGPYDFLFLASTLLGLYAIHRLLGFREEGEAPADAVLRGMRREVGQVSSVAGMRAFAHLATYVVEGSYRFERALDVKNAARRPDPEPDSTGKRQA